MFWRKKKPTPATDSERPRSEQQSSESVPTQAQEVPQNRNPAVFEFGKQTSSGLIMQGVCTTEVHSNIPACIWRVTNAADFKQAQNEPKYHIEF